MCEEYMSSQEIRQAIAALKIRLALQLDFEREADALIVEADAIDPEQTRHVRDMEARVLGDIARHTDKRHSRANKFLRRRSARVIALIAVLLLVGLGSSLATVELIRSGVWKLNVQTYSTHTDYSLVPSDNIMEIPQNWAGSFYPAYIPEGFELYMCSTVLPMADYRDSNDKQLCYTEDTYGTTTSLDTENAELSTADINGSEATVIEKKGWCAVVWSTNNRIFIVDMGGAEEDRAKTKEEVLKVARSVTLVD